MTFVGRFFLAVLALGFVEVYLLVKVAGRIGFFPTVGLCILTGVIGAALVRRQGLQTMRQIQAFQHVRKTGEVTPSGWKPGAQTLKPGPDLAGKVWKVWKP